MVHYQSIKFALVGVIYEVCIYAFANMFVASTRIVLRSLQPYEGHSLR